MQLVSPAVVCLPGLVLLDFDAKLSEW